MTNIFEKLLNIDVSAHVEKKGKFNYLSWPWAVAELRKADPKATWAVQHFEYNGAVQPFMTTVCGTFVVVSVTVDGIELRQVHPVLNHVNKPIEKPNAFDINTSIQRCLVKAIALHGLGLSIYAGEDLPTNSSKESQSETKTDSKEDDNAPSSYDEMIAKIEGAKDLEDLAKDWKKYHGWFKGEELAKLIMAKDERKVELAEGGK